MTTAASPQPVACAECTLAFAEHSQLRRHIALDHRPDPDGAQLTVRLLASSRARAAAPHAAGATPASDVPDRGPAHRSPAPVRPVLATVFVVMLLGLGLPPQTVFLALLVGAVVVGSYALRSGVLADLYRRARAGPDDPTGSAP